MPADITTIRANNLNRPFAPRHDGEAPVRCWACATIIATVVDFSGSLEIRCRHCKADTRFTGSESDRSSNTALDRRGRRRVSGMLSVTCSTCDGVLFFASFDYAGTIRRRCVSCRVECSVYGVGRAPNPFSDMDADGFIAMMEERWLALFKEFSRRRAEVAVGLRFDVFKRDGFRCRYCGRSADDGAILHADHVIPQSKGGPTVLSNLVTACFECNIGKSDKDLDDVRPMI